MTSKVTIIGGGIIGLLSARSLIHAGFQVQVVDKSAIGRESSWAGGGILSPLYPWRYSRDVNVLAAWSQSRYPVLCEQLLTETGIDPQWRRSGLLILDAEGENITSWMNEFGGESTWLQGAEDIKRIEPRLAAMPANTLWMPHIAQVRNPRLLAAIRAELEANGCEFHEMTAVSGFRYESGQLTGIETEQGVIDTEKAIVATGAWTAGLMAALGVTVPIRPVRGQMLLLRSEPGWLQRMVLLDQRYVIPREDGHILVGSTLEETGFDKSTTEQAKAELLAAAEKLVSGLSRFPVVHHWAGLRPGSPTGVPVISAVPDLPGVVICAGHFRNGFVLGPASARLAVDLLLGRPPVIDPSAYVLESI